MTPILLFDGECAVCRGIGRWVERAASRAAGPPSIDARPIGQDPAALRRLNPQLDIWAAYASPHVLMPDGSMKLGGAAVAEVFRRLPETKWFAGIFDIHLLGTQPFQAMLNFAYAVLADIRPLLGCESCGRPRLWVRPLAWIVNQAKALLGHAPDAKSARHFTALRKAAPGVRL